MLEFGRIGIWKLRAIIRLQFQWDYFSKEMGDGTKLGSQIQIDLVHRVQMSPT